MTFLSELATFRGLQKNHPVFGQFFAGKNRMIFLRDIVNLQTNRDPGLSENAINFLTERPECRTMD